MGCTLPSSRSIRQGSHQKEVTIKCQWIIAFLFSSPLFSLPGKASFQGHSRHHRRFAIRSGSGIGGRVCLGLGALSSLVGVHFWLILHGLHRNVEPCHYDESSECATARQHNVAEVACYRPPRGHTDGGTSNPLKVKRVGAPPSASSRVLTKPEVDMRHRCHPYQGRACSLTCT